MKSEVDYFDIHIGDTVTLVEFVEAHKSVGKDGRDVSQSLDIYKVIPASSNPTSGNPANSNKIHYLYAHEIDNELSADANGVPNNLISNYKG